MSNTVIKVENVSKYYRLGLIGGGTLREDINRWYAAFRGLPDPLLKVGEADHGNRKGDQIWALKDVNFEVKEGEILGVIGRNGAGKSTLLKILSRITAPTEGRITIKGRVGSLLEVGTGFHPELTGRENIYLNGTILGMKKFEVNSRLEEIIAFAEMGKFIDTPVKRYSSGMTVRLAFAVAAHLEPEILIIDEVLAVGDVAFQKKCLGKMQEVSKAGRTVIFVSHNMNSISQLCSRTILMSHGQAIEDAETDDVIVKYLTADSKSAGEMTWADGISNKGEASFKFHSVKVLNHHDKPTSQLRSTSSFKIEIDYEVYEKINNSRVGLLITTIQGIVLFEAYDTDLNFDNKDREAGRVILRCKIPKDLLVEGQYFISLNAGIPGNKNLAFIENVLTFHITNTGSPSSLLVSKTRGLIRPSLQWDSTKHHIETS